MERKIAKGPSRRVLFESFTKYFESEGQRVVFYTHEDKKIIGHICSLTYIDTTGSNFLFTIRVRDNHFYSGEFNTRERTGRIDLPDDF